MLRGVWQALNSLSIHVTFTAMVPGDARSVGDSHPSCSQLLLASWFIFAARSKLHFSSIFLSFFWVFHGRPIRRLSRRPNSWRFVLFIVGCRCFNGCPGDRSVLLYTARRGRRVAIGRTSSHLLNGGWNLTINLGEVRDLVVDVVCCRVDVGRQATRLACDNGTEVQVAGLEDGEQKLWRQRRRTVVVRRGCRGGGQAATSLSQSSVDCFRVDELHCLIGYRRLSFTRHSHCPPNPHTHIYRAGISPLHSTTVVTVLLLQTA